MMQTLPNAESGSPEVTPETFGPEGRYQVLSRLGQGGYGTVYRARDARFGSLVAVKALRGLSAPSLFRFKQEFRALADIAHRNLVRLFEFSADGWFVVMELVDGDGLLEHLTGARGAVVERTADDAAFTMERFAVARRRAPDASAVREVFLQLAQGLSALHAAGKLHRDVKPSNVMVTRDGRVVLLDFGLIMDEGQGARALLGDIAGTPAYMAPEQLAGETLTPASDWYAVGATLHEALVGEAPLPGDASRLEELGEGSAAEGLIALCRALLDPDPLRRPQGVEVLAALGGMASTPGVLRTGLVGREDALRALDAVFARSERAPQLARVEGASGVGKTALAAAWVARLDASARRPWTLRGRCLEHEHIPYKAVDGVVDALVSLLLDSPAAVRRAVLGEPLLGAEPLTRMFPVLAGLHELSGVVDASGVDPQTRRDRALDGLRALFARLAAVRPVVILIEDAHWGDADSARVLAALLRPELRGVTVLTTQRGGSDVEALPAALAAWLAHGPAALEVTDLALGELDPDAAQALARACLGDLPDLASRAAEVARESRGNPFFIRQMAEQLRAFPEVVEVASLSTVLGRQLTRATPAVQRVVEVLSVAARPLAAEVVARAARVDVDEVRPAIHAAERSRLVAGVIVQGRQQLETGHARVREAVCGAMSADATRGYHLSIADALMDFGQREPEVLLPHLLGGGDAPRATAAALDAAGRAEGSFAFTRAAELYRIVLDLDVDPSARGDLLTRRGEALSHAGRSADAAAVFEDVLAGATDLDDARRARHPLRRRSAELWLRSGYVSKGMRGFREVLGAHGVALPATDKDAQRESAWRRLRLLVRGLRFKERPEREVAPEVLERLDALWSATTSLAMLRFLLADAVALRHLLEALDVGEPSRIVRALAFEASLEALLGGWYFDRRCKRMLEHMERLAQGLSSEDLATWATMSRGVTRWYQGDWEAAWTGCRAASERYAAQPRAFVWELAICDVYSLSAATYLAKFAELAALVPERHRAARERGDLYATANLAFYESFLLLVRDRPEEAIRCADESIAPFLDEEFLANRYGITYAVAQGELYAGRFDAAWDRVESAWESWRGVGMLLAQCVRVEARYLRARAALALLTGTSPDAPRAARARRTLREDIRVLAGDRCPPAAPMSLALKAGAAALEGRTAEVRRLLAEAAEGFGRCGMALHAAAARHHLAGLGAGEAARDEDAQGVEAFRVQGVARPEKMFHLAITGFSA